MTEVTSNETRKVGMDYLAHTLKARAEMAGVAMTKAQSREILNDIFDTIVEEVESGAEVRIPSFGKFLPVYRKAQQKSHPQDPTKVVMVNPYYAATFKAFKQFKERVKSTMAVD